jgi:hypothetical protein
MCGIACRVDVAAEVDVVACPQLADDGVAQRELDAVFGDLRPPTDRR